MTSKKKTNMNTSIIILATVLVVLSVIFMANGISSYIEVYYKNRSNCKGLSNPILVTFGFAATLFVVALFIVLLLLSNNLKSQLDQIKKNQPKYELVQEPTYRKISK